MTIMTTPSALANKLENAQLQRNQLQQTEEDEEIIVAEQLQPGEGQLELPPHLCSSLRLLSIQNCLDLTLVQQEGLQGLSSLVSLEIGCCPKFLSDYASSPCCPFPSSLERLHLKGMGATGPRGEGFWTFLTQGHIAVLSVIDCPGYFAGLATTLVQNEKIWSHKLQDLNADDAAALFTTPLCSLLSSSLTKLCLSDDMVVTFTEDQGYALQLLTSLQVLEFLGCRQLEALPPFLDRLSKLERIGLTCCPRLRWSVQKLPSSLQVLDVRDSNNDALIQECRKLRQTIPEVLLSHHLFDFDISFE
ncbi:hypothetical protein EJB05_40744, partial [Eragrostis curvula]